MAGDQDPVIPFSEVPGRGARAEPEQIAATGVKAGVILELTATVMEAVTAHSPAAGLKVYVVVAVLLMAGDQLPLMPSSEDEGNTKLPPEHIAPIGANCGVTGSLTVTVRPAAVAQADATGVNV